MSIKSQEKSPKALLIVMKHMMDYIFSNPKLHAVCAVMQPVSYRERFVPFTFRVQLSRPPGSSLMISNDVCAVSRSRAAGGVL